MVIIIVDQPAPDLLLHLFDHCGRMGEPVHDRFILLADCGKLPSPCTEPEVKMYAVLYIRHDHIRQLIRKHKPFQMIFLFPAKPVSLPVL